MELTGYLNIIKRRKWWIIGCVGVVIFAVLIYTYLFQTTIYEANSWIVIKEQNLESTLLPQAISELSTEPQRTLDTQVELLKTKEMAKKVINSLQIDLSSGELMSKVSIGPLQQTNMILITVKDHDPEMAKAIANEYATVFQEWRRSDDAKEVSNARSEVSNVLQSTKDEAVDISNQIASSANNPATLERLRAEQQTKWNSYADLQNIYHELSISEDLISGGLGVITDEDTPSTPVSPKPTRNVILAFFLGIALGLVLALVVDYMDDTIETREEAQRICKVPVLGEIPSYRELEDQQRRSSLVMIGEPNSPVSEAFRALRNNIQFLKYEHEVETLIITSARPGEGKTFVLANLAVALAEAGHRVLAISADMRKPALHELFHLKNEKGLSTVLVGNKSLKECLQITGKHNLQILTSGPIPTNPSELMGSKRMNEVLSESRTIADFVLIDIPPVLIASDAVALAPRTDAVILVMELDNSKRDDAKKTCDLLLQVKSNLAGIILNKTKETKSYGYYNYSNDIKNK